MKPGDLVRAKEDLRRGLECFGLVVEVIPTSTWDENPERELREECFVLWASESTPMGWWWADLLEAVNDRVL